MTVATPDDLADHLVQRFGDRVRPSRSRPGAWVLDEVAELVACEVGGHVGLRLGLPGGVLLDRLFGVELEGFESPVRLEGMLDVLDVWSAAASDPQWSPRAELLLDGAVELLREDERRGFALPLSAYPPLVRQGEAYECLHVAAAPHANPDGDVDGVEMRVRGPFWRDGVGDERSAVVLVDERGSLDRPALERAFEDCAAQLLPAEFFEVYNSAYREFATDTERGWWARWGALSDRVQGGEDDQSFGIEELSALVVERFGPRVTGPSILEADTSISGHWVIDGAVTLVVSFTERGIGSDIRFPNGVATMCLFGRRIISVRNDEYAARGLDRVDQFVSLLQGKATT